MTADSWFPARRGRWHPVPLGWALLGAAVLAAAPAVAGWVVPSPWLVIGAAAGFATSGST